MAGWQRRSGCRKAKIPIFASVREQTVNVRSIVRKCQRVLVQSRVSPVSRPAILLTLTLAVAGLVASISTNFVMASLPNVMPLVAGIIAIDAISQFAPRTRIVEAVQTFIYGVLYLVTTCLFGVLAAYGMQRFAFPLQDHFLAGADAALGLHWLDFASWLDRHGEVQSVLHVAYNTISIQIALPLLVLAFSHEADEARVYLLAFAIAFTLTIFVSALMPAAGPIASVDRTAFHILRFTGATPLDHLMRLREAGPLVLREAPGGIATFPSFHATIAILTPLALHRYRRILIALIFLDAAMLGATITEGAHYFSDVIAGSCVALFAYLLARRIIGVEANPFRRTGEAAGRLSPAAHAR